MIEYSVRILEISIKLWYLSSFLVFQVRGNVTDKSSNVARSFSSTESTENQIDIRVIMADIRDRVREDLAKNKDIQPKFIAKTASDENHDRKAGELLYSEELRYLNEHYAHQPTLNLEAITTHRRGLLAKLIVKFKRKVLATVWDHLLKDFFTAERDYQAHLVRFINDSTKYIDARDASNFWELIQKIDYDVTKALERIERIADEQSASLRSSEKGLHEELNRNLRELNQAISKSQELLSGHDAKLETLEGVARGLERIVAQLTDRSWQVPAAPESSAKDIAPDQSYVLLENRFRGSEENISERQAFYADYFSEATKPILDIGPGRGELLKIFKGKNIKAYGVDVDEAMVARSKEQSLEVFHGDGIAHLRSLEDRSIGGVIALQVVEHLTRQQLEELFRLCNKKIEKGGKVIFETINPRSLLALSSNYFRDPTHIWPLHPDTLSYSMELGGLKVIETKNLSPVPDEAQLRVIKPEVYMTPRWQHTLELLNRNFSQLNDLLYGFQDYCVIAEVP